MSKAARAELYRSYLAEEGYVPRLDPDGDVISKAEGRTYLVLVDDEDEDFFRLVFPKFWSIDSEDERARVAAAALHATAVTKVAKVFPVEDDTWAAVELFCSPPASFAAVFPRALGALRAAVETFRQQMQH